MDKPGDHQRVGNDIKRVRILSLSRAQAADGKKLSYESKVTARITAAARYARVKLSKKRIYGTQRIEDVESFLLVRGVLDSSSRATDGEVLKRYTIFAPIIDAPTNFPVN